MENGDCVDSESRGCVDGEIVDAMKRAIRSFRSDNDCISQKQYLESIRASSCHLVYSIVGSAGHLALASAGLVAICQTAQLVARGISPLFGTWDASILDNQNYAVPLAALGFVGAVIGFLLICFALRRHRERRDGILRRSIVWPLISVVLHIGCGFLAAYLFAEVLKGAPSDGSQWMNWVPYLSLFGLAYLCSCAHILSLSPFRWKQIGQWFSRGKRYGMLSVLCHVSLITPFLLGGLLGWAPRVHRELFLMVCVSHSLFSVIWFGTVGMQLAPLRRWLERHLRQEERGRTSSEDDNRTPAQWTNEFMPYFMLTGASAFASLVMLIILSAVVFQLLQTLGIMMRG